MVLHGHFSEGQSTSMLMHRTSEGSQKLNVN